MTDEKEFDCIEFKRRASRRLHEKLSGMSEQDRREFWRRRTKESQEEQNRLNRDSEDSDDSDSE